MMGKCEVTGEKGSVPLAETVNPGVLTVKTNLPAPGWWNGNTPDTIDSGFEYCIAANIAHLAGLDGVKVEEVSFPALIAGQERGFDLSLDQVTITPEREKVVTFTPPYFTSNLAVLTKAGSDVSQANIGTKTIGVPVGSTAEMFVKDQLKPQTPARVFPDLISMQTAVLSGQIDAGILDTSTILGIAKASDGKLDVVGQYQTDENYGGILPKDSPNTDAINKAVDQLVSDGTVAKLKAQWLGAELGVNPDDVPMWQLS